MDVIYMQYTHRFTHVNIEIYSGRESEVSMALDPGLYTRHCKP
jgi:hypothetical protein